MNKLSAEKTFEHYIDTPMGRVAVPGAGGGQGRPVLTQEGTGNEVMTTAESDVTERKFGRYLGLHGGGFIVMVYGSQGDDWNIRHGEAFTTFEELLRYWQID